MLTRIRRFLFGDSAHAFGTLSVVLLLCLAITPAKDVFQPQQTVTYDVAVSDFAGKPVSEFQ